MLRVWLIREKLTQLSPTETLYNKPNMLRKTPALIKISDFSLKGVVVGWIVIQSGRYNFVNGKPKRVVTLPTCVNATFSH